MCTQCVCVSIYLVKVYWTIFPLLCLAVVFPCQSVNLSWVSQRLTFNIGNIFGLKENYCDPLLRHWGWCREWYIYLKGQACLRPMQDFVPDLQFGWLVVPQVSCLQCWPPLLLLSSQRIQTNLLRSQICHHPRSLPVIQEKYQKPLTLNSSLYSLDHPPPPPSTDPDFRDWQTDVFLEAWFNTGKRTKQMITIVHPSHHASDAN